MKKGLAGLLAAVLLLLSPPILGGDCKPIVAVFNVEAKRVDLSNKVLELLSDNISTLLTESGKYQVVPRSELKKRIVHQKKRSFKECYDKSCQIEMGRELAAEKTLSTQVFKLGKRRKKLESCHLKLSNQEPTSGGFAVRSVRNGMVPGVLERAPSTWGN